MHVQELVLKVDVERVGYFSTAECDGGVTPRSYPERRRAAAEDPAMQRIESLMVNEWFKSLDREREARLQVRANKYTAPA